MAIIIFKFEKQVVLGYVSNNVISSHVTPTSNLLNSVYFTKILPNLAQNVDTVMLIFTILSHIYST